MGRKDQAKEPEPNETNELDRGDSTDTVDGQLRVNADTAKGAAEAALADARSMSEAAARMHVEAQAKVDEANRAADEAAREVIRLQAELAAAHSSTKAAEAEAAIAKARIALDEAEQVKAEAAEAAAAATALADQTRPAVPSFRIEGGGWMPLGPGFGPRDRQVSTPNGLHTYDHVSDHPVTGDWIYRAHR